MTLRDILRHKGTEIFTANPDDTLADVVHRLVECNCGSLVVCESDETSVMVGIITERDILRACAKGKATLSSTRVAEIMSRDVITGTPDDSVEQTMGQMTENRIRHLPVLDGDALAGIISIGDVVKAQFDHLQMENHYLKEYIQG